MTLALGYAQPGICPRRELRDPPDAYEFPDRFVKHDFRAENPNVLWESLSTG
jgi:hypothetical protein